MATELLPAGPRQQLFFFPRQSVGGGKFIQKRQYLRSPLLKTTALEGKLTFGDIFLDSGVVCMTLDTGPR